MIDVTPLIQHFFGCPSQRKAIISENLFRYNINIKKINTEVIPRWCAFLSRYYKKICWGKKTIRIKNTLIRKLNKKLTEL